MAPAYTSGGPTFEHKDPVRNVAPDTTLSIDRRNNTGAFVAPSVTYRGTFRQEVAGLIYAAKPNSPTACVLTSISLAARAMKASIADPPPAPPA